MTPEERKRLKKLSKKDRSSVELTEAEEIDLNELLRARRLEQIFSIPRPACCEEIQRFPAVVFGVDTFDDASSSDAPGRWFPALHREVAEAMRSIEDAGVVGPYQRLPEAKFCPFCGSPLPKMRRKIPPPKNICLDENGNYCSTCSERLDHCLCDRPETAFEAAPAAPAERKPPTLDDITKTHLRTALMVSRGNKAEAARILDIDRRTLYRMLDRMKLHEVE